MEADVLILQSSPLLFRWHQQAGMMKCTQEAIKMAPKTGGSRRQCFPSRWRSGGFLASPWTTMPKPFAECWDLWCEKGQWVWTRHLYLVILQAVEHLRQGLGVQPKGACPPVGTPMTFCLFCDLCLQEWHDLKPQSGSAVFQCAAESAVL